MSAHIQHTHKEDTVFLQTAIAVMFGTYVFHWKIENFGGIQHTKLYTFSWEENEMRMTTRSCSYGKIWRFWVKLKK